jgi:hypothetical protein
MRGVLVVVQMMDGGEMVVMTGIELSLEDQVSD